MKRNAVITGLGIVSPIGTGVEKFWKAACLGQSGIRKLTQFDGSQSPRECQIVGEVPDFRAEEWMPGRAGKMAGRFSQFAVASTKMALSDTHLDLNKIDPNRIHVMIGTSTNGLRDVYDSNFVAFLGGGEAKPWGALEYPAHSATSHVGILIGARGRMSTFATACAAGLDAIGWAAEAIQRNEATVVLAGATETPLSAFLLEAFRAVGVLSKWPGPPAEASRPFDKLRAGLVLAEGAAVVVMEEEEHARVRRAPMYARILGFANSSEGSHLRKVDESGASDARTMTLALMQAGLFPRNVDYISAHGNSMVDYDAAETAGIKLAFGRHAWNIPVSSLKSMLGQSLAASGAMQVVGACLTLRDGIVPPTINYQVPDPSCDLDYVPNVARRVRVRTLLIHAHSMGGSHSAMVLTKPD